MQFSDTVKEHLHKKYGNSPDQVIENRVNRELHLADFFSMVKQLTAYFDLSQYLREHEIPYWVRGATASSFLINLLGISFANPLPPHYYCPACKKIIWDDSVQDGFDLPPRICGCGQTMHGDGHDIPLESFWGVDRADDEIKLSHHNLHIDVPAETYSEVQKFLCDHPASAGLPTEQREPCFHMGKISIQSDQSLPKRDPKWFTGISGGMVKQKILHHYKDESMEILPSIIKSGFVPATFHDLVQIFGLSHGTGTWKENGEQLVAYGVPLLKLPANYDDVFAWFVAHSFLPKDAWMQAERIHMGKGLTILPDESFDDNWLTEYCNRIYYMFSKAHTVEYYIYYANLDSEKAL